MILRRKVRRVVVLGCGPAGIFAAQAAADLGLEVTIYSRKRRSEMFGAQYLHAPIPGLTSMESESVNYRLDGTPEEYAAKVYGDDIPEFVSPESLLGRHPCWNIREAYYLGYSKFQDAIVDVPLLGRYSITPLREKSHADIFAAFMNPRGTQIISTVPLPALCRARGRHEFRARAIWAAGEAPERGQFLDGFQIDPFTVQCNGEKAPSWYRLSNVYGYKTCEWPYRDGMKPPYSSVANVEKVVGTDCTCLASLGNVWVAGRSGAWDKRVLAHSAYYDTLAKLKKVI